MSQAGVDSRLALCGLCEASGCEYLSYQHDAAGGAASRGSPAIILHLTWHSSYSPYTVITQFPNDIRIPRLLLTFSSAAYFFQCEAYVCRNLTLSQGQMTSLTRSVALQCKHHPPTPIRASSSTETMHGRNGCSLAATRCHHSRNKRTAPPNGCGLGPSRTMTVQYSHQHLQADNQDNHTLHCPQAILASIIPSRSALQHKTALGIVRLRVPDFLDMFSNARLLLSNRKNDEKNKTKKQCSAHAFF